MENSIKKSTKITNVGPWGEGMLLSGSCLLPWFMGRVNVVEWELFITLVHGESRCYGVGVVYYLGP